MELKLKKGNTKHPLLSKKDEGVPLTHIPMYEIFIADVKSREYLGEGLATKLRVQTYKNILKLFNQYGSRDFDRFWNIHINEIVDLKLIEFAKYEELEPICRYIECFTETKKDRKLVSFGINIELLKKYYAEKKRCEQTGEKFIPPELIKRGKAFNRDMVLYGDYRFIVGENKRLPIERNEIWKRFEHWRQLKKLTNREACFLAIKTIVDLNPIDGVKEIEDYRVETVFDKVYLTKKDRSTPKHFTLYINGAVYEQAKVIVDRYNNDERNKDKAKLTMTEYINNGIQLLNSKMDLKYSNPELLEEKKKLDEYMQYVNEQLEGDI